MGVGHDFGNRGSCCVPNRISEVTGGEPAVSQWSLVCGSAVKDEGRERGGEGEVLTIVFRGSGTGVRDSG